MTRLFPPDDDCIGKIHAQLEHLWAIRQGTPFAYAGQKPTREQLSQMAEVAFWSSLRSNEGRATRVRLTLVASDQVPNSITFANPTAYEEGEIAKLAPAVPPGGCLGVDLVSDNLRIWGLLERFDVSGLNTVSVETSQPGTVRVDVGPFQPYAVLDGRSNHVLAATRTDLAHYLRRKLKKELPSEDFAETQAVWRECLALVDLARAILTDSHGGAILIVPSESGEWSKSLNPFAFQFTVADSRIRDIIRKELSDAHDQSEALQELYQAGIPDELKNRAVNAFSRNSWISWRPVVQLIGPFAGVDGAIVMTRDMQLLGFGAKIEIKQAFAGPLIKLRVVPGEQECVPSRLEDLGGTRHQSAARFVEANRDTLAIVLSQDRHVSVMHWEEELNAVVAMRGAEWWL